VNEQRTKVFLDRYAAKDTTGEPFERTPMEMWARVSKAIANDDAEAEAFFRIMHDFKFVPGGRILAGAGTETEVTYYNCYVIPIETKNRRLARADALLHGVDFIDPGSDSREAILDTVSVMVDIMSRGGGVGINWSVLRPKGAHLSRVNGTTSGPVSWMDVASHAVQTVTQGGSRRGAAMFMLDDWHPDVLEFIDAKRDFQKITGANVSVSVSDAFMEALRLDSTWVFGFPDTTHPAYNAEWDGDLDGWAKKGYPVVEYGEIRARDMWRKIAESAWSSGEPGVVFLDRYNELSTGKGVERLIAVNPCGEQGLGPYSVCNLGSMNLDAYVVPKPKGGFEFDWTNFTNDVEVAVQFLDNVVDKNFYFLPDNEQQQMNLRRIGLGVMGLADALIALKLRYGSNAAVEFTERVFSTMKTAAIRRSCVLAQQKGKAPAWDLKETYKRPYFREYLGTPLGQQIKKYGLRNMFLLTQAPTGSTSILSGVNSGIEPYFDFKYTREDRTGTHVVLAAALEKYGSEGMTKTQEWVTANDVSVEEHLTMQAAVQTYVDSSVSKTINGPYEHTVEDVERAFTLAYDKGLKGLAYFRDGSGRDQVLYRGEKKEDNDRIKFLENELAYAQAQNGWMADEIDAMSKLLPYFTEFVRPEVLDGTTVKAGTRAGTAYITVNRDPADGRAVEVFFNVGKAGSDVASMAEALGRLASLALRKGATLGGVANQLEGVGGQAQFNKPIPHAIGEALTRANKQGDKKPNVTVADAEGTATTETLSSTPAERQKYDLCPECGTASLVREEGCAKCLTCGFSQC